MKNKWLDVMVCFMIYVGGVALSVLKVYIIWLPWLLIFMRIQEIFNVTDGRDRNFDFDVDFPFLSLRFLSKEFGLA